MKEQIVASFWLVVGYLFLFAAVEYKSPIIFFAGLCVSSGSMIMQPYMARIPAMPWEFIKGVRRSFYAAETEVEQFQFKEFHTYYAQDLTQPNLTIFGPLASPWKHPRYGGQGLLLIEHEGEFRDHVRLEHGEITFWGTSGVEHGKVDILDLWETPRVHPIGLRVYPIHVIAKGGAADYDKWVNGEIAKLEPEMRRETIRLAKI